MFGIERLQGKVAPTSAYDRPLPTPIGSWVAPPAAPEKRPQGASGFQDGFASLVAAILPAAAQGKPVEVWFMDEARVGQQGTLTRVWAPRGTRPRALRDHRRNSAYLFGAVCPERGTGAAVVLPHVNVEAMTIHLAEISRSVTEGAHAVLVLDQVGWHTSLKLHVPENISLMPLPPYAPELNPVEQSGRGLPKVPAGVAGWNGKTRATCGPTSSAIACGTATTPSWVPAAMPGTS